MKKDKRSKIILILIISLIILLLIVVGILVFIKDKDEGVIQGNNINSKVEEKEAEEARKEQIRKDERIRKLKSVSESERIRTYLGTYFMLIENKEYEKAYELLYQEFKNNYFPTLEDFEKYIQEQAYPDKLAIEYNEISTQGEYYIVKVQIKDFITGIIKRQEMSLIIKENGYDDYYLSFTK